MAAPTAMVPYDQDPSNNVLQHLENLIACGESPSRYLLPNKYDDSSASCINDHEIVGANSDGNDSPLIDPSWENFNTDQLFDDLQQEPPDETDDQGGDNTNKANYNGNPIPLAIWPVPPEPYACTCCQVLREIIHTNGIHM